MFWHMPKIVSFNQSPSAPLPTGCASLQFSFIETLRIVAVAPAGWSVCLPMSVTSRGDRFLRFE
jgi:hypothetical protein